MVQRARTELEIEKKSSLHFNPNNLFFVFEWWPGQNKRRNNCFEKVANKWSTKTGRDGTQLFNFISRHMSVVILRGTTRMIRDVMVPEAGPDPTVLLPRDFNVFLRHTPAMTAVC